MLRLEAGDGSWLVTFSPIYAGMVMQIHVEVGDEVKTGQALAVVEAMKMENVLRAEADGVVATINAGPGDSLAVDDVILELE